ncbi:MAG: gliding motility-associated C-terminal domain-containing protein [Saprospiraceae bacterium]|nr:gliding motility-associated C-terminal domain-containing protein [Saprospiraceae bacterium]MCF8251223.1 gliding motility-associated C-terminal domain-containing protein [Saprospiraceae bacterium]MCF8281207.1 gliding motility-associated C-terminal domain-containing protein [Bacteroidales bacterium]MCF8313153.1 gliding motility-associated C-terminal domain-containing protein [Saprospiraceae bacterium]MCF8441585.1 gliding motility-associated C-terminal domain-containing protein [Saprospiraceae 
MVVSLLDACFVYDTLAVSLCPGESLTVGSHTYAQTGVYLDTLGALPCDTIRLTNLTVLDGVSTQAAIVNICAGGAIQLQAQGGQVYAWSPAAGLSATNIANPVASPSQTTTYAVIGFMETENLIVNGDFEQGNTGFTSSYAYSPFDIGPQAVYDILADVNDAHPLAAHCHDHTTSTGKLMAANGAGTLNTTVWQQTVPVAPQTDYIFSAWVTNWSAPTVPLSKLQFSVNGQLLGSVFQPVSTSCEWEKFDEIWNSGNATSAIIRLVNQNTEVNGNDFGLDDIHFSRICTNTDTVTVVVHQPVVQNMAPTICQGETFTVGNTQYNQTGSYSNTLQTIYGCDSTVLTNLTVLPTFQTTQSPVICEGDSVIVGASIYTTSGQYSDMLTATNGCDSTVTTQLTVNPSYQIDQTLVICEGESIIVGNNTYTVSGIYTDALQTVSGCDSTVLTNLTVLPIFQTTQSPVICEGDSVIVGASVYNASGIYTNVLQAMNGCDSTVTTQLTVNPSYQINQTLVICEGESIIVGNNTYTMNGIYTDALQTVNGCDSSITTNLTVLPIFQTTQSPVICQGDSVIVGTSVYTASGIYTNVLPATNGCDSAVTTLLTVNPAYQISQSLNICEGESIIVGGNTYFATGNYTDSLQTISGCDSIITTALTVLPTLLLQQSLAFCEGESVYSQSGIYVDTFQSQNGCDSIVTSSVVLYPLAYTQQSFSFCQGDSVVVGNSTYYQQGIYKDTLQTWHGCDSILTTNITILPVKTTTQAITLCEGENIAVGSNTYTQSGNYMDTLQTWQGCDSTVMTSLTVLPAYYQSLDVILCEGETYTLGNHTYGQTGTFSDTLQSTFGGCDSIVNLKLTVSVLDANLSTVSPFCFGDENGALTVTQTTGGTEPYVYSINDTAYFSPNTMFSNLPGGTHLLWIEDANGCQKTFPFSLDEPFELQLDLSDIIQIELGESVQLSPNLNFVPDSIVWSPAEGLSCTNCMNPTANPFETVNYHLWVQNENGCSMEGQIQIIVRRSGKVFIPNVFSPNGDGINDNFIPFVGGSVKAIRKLLIFDRWGGQVFEGGYLTLNEPTQGWDGTDRGLPVNTGVFAWLAEVEFVNGQVEVFKGDVTVVR